VGLNGGGTARGPQKNDSESLGETGCRQTADQGKPRHRDQAAPGVCAGAHGLECRSIDQKLAYKAVQRRQCADGCRPYQESGAGARHQPQQAP